MSQGALTPFRLQQVSFFEVQSPLLEFSNNIASQTGEDGIIQRIFEIIEPENSYCVEFGAWDGKHLSNCWNLIVNCGWSGCFIEANEDKYTDLIANHGENERVSCVNKFVDFSGENSLDSILSSVGAPENLDFISIDVDGTDYFVWESLEDHRPKLVVIEFNPTIPNDIIFVQAKDSSVNQGCSLLALIQLGKIKGYELICCTRWNAFFVLQELYPTFNIEKNSIFHMYRPVMDGRIFHGYDAHIYVVGMSRLLWHNVQISTDDFQVLPKALRKFGGAQEKR